MKKHNELTEQINIRLTKQLKDKINDEAKKRGLNLKSLLIAAFWEFIKSEGNFPKKK